MKVKLRYSYDSDELGHAAHGHTSSTTVTEVQADHFANTLLPLLAGHSGASHRAGGSLRTRHTPLRGGSLRGAGDTL